MSIDEIFSNSLSFLSSNVRDLRKELFSDFHLKPFREVYLAQKADEDPVLLRAFKTDLTQILYDHLTYAVSKCSAIENESEHITFIIYGEQGSGKSVLAIKIALLYKKLHKKFWNRIIGIHFTFSDAESLAKISEIDDFSIVIQDENPKISGLGSRSAITSLGNLLEEGRFAGRSYIKCAPHRESIPGCTYYLRPAGMCIENNNNIYLRTLVFQSDDEGSKLKATGHFIVEISSAFEYMKKSNYNKLKEENFRKLTEQMGSESAVTAGRIKKLNEYAKKLYSHALNLGWSGTKKDLKSYLSLIDIPVSTAEAQTVVVLAHNMYKEDKRKKKEEKEKESAAKYNKLTQFNANEIENEIINDLLNSDKSKTISRDIEIYNLCKSAMSLDKIAFRFSISAERVRQVKKKMSGTIDQKMGHIYETFFSDYLQSQGIYDKVNNLGGVGQPDIVCVKGNICIIYSVKCLYFSRASFSISYEEFRPEIEYARNIKSDFESVTVIAHVYNRYNNRIYEKEIESDVVSKNIPIAVYKKKSFLIKL